MREVQIRNNSKLPGTNIIDRAISFISPNAAARRMQARIFMAVSGAYYGGSKSRRALSQWVVPKGDADQDLSPELEILRERSRDLVRNNPLAAGAIKTKVTSVIGNGLTLKSRIDREVLGLDEETADKWENRTEAEWKLFADSTGCDVEDTSNFAQIQELSFRSTLENGDCFVLTPMNKAVRRVYSLQLQLIEADRVSNMNNISDSETLSGGVERSKYGGAPV